MLLEERRAKILAILIKNERVLVNNLAELFSVSKETIRRDLSYLEKNQAIERCYGGAILNKKNVMVSFRKEMLSNISDLLKHQDAIKVMTEEKKGKVCVFGSFNVDIVSYVARLPHPGETIVSQSCSFGPGGKGANQAIAASNAMCKVDFITKVGNDQLSSHAYSHLEASNIDSLTIYVSDSAPTGNALIYVSELDGENMIAINQGANVTITDEEIINSHKNILNSNILLVQLENNLSATINAIKYARENDVTVILNPAPFTSYAKIMLPFVDIVTPNQTEATLLSGINITDIETAKKAAERIAQMGPQCVIVTLGNKGALLYDKGQFYMIPAYPAMVVDTTGAGDAFNGALAASLSKGETIKHACHYAAAFSSLAVELNGASNMPEHKNVLIRLNESSYSKM